ncbi:unnamed protein product [Clavelina lepadiformis]|uniref:SF4 helicase domain-containing protein n=1 Tax=Clavelina lepadiformis TaxID=159417 RepID=A0ABP0G103_CLALP
MNKYLSDLLADEIKVFLHKKNIQFENGWACIKCRDVFGHTSAGLNTYINKTTGDFYCVSGHCGSWELFKAYCVANAAANSRESHGLEKKALAKCNDKIALNHVRKIWNDTCISFDDTETCNAVFKQYHLDASDFSQYIQYAIRYQPDTKYLTLGYFNDKNSSQIKGVKIIHDTLYCVKEISNTSLDAYTVYPKNGIETLFGLSNVNCKSSQIILTANEFDAMAINISSSKYTAISLPQGVMSLPLQLIPQLEKFDEIILWFGNHILSLEAARHFSKKLCAQRCKIVRPRITASTAMQALKAGVDIDKIIGSAVPSVMKNVVAFSDLRRQIKDELENSDKLMGVPFRRFHNLNKKLKGHRRGELTIITGPTGSGKTTFLSELSLDLASQGVSTLWGSFEVNNHKLLKIMLRQYAQLRVESHIEQFESIAEKFEKLPISFMTFNGPENISNVLKTMYHVTYANDIQHIIIDNLQFLLGYEKGLDRFSQQDYAVSEFRKFATKHHVHISLVIHPRKEDPYMPLHISSIFGTAKATQEADSVLIIQQIPCNDDRSMSKKTLKFVEIVKNRFDGDLGKIRLYFNPDTLCMSPSLQSSSERNLTLISTKESCKVETLLRENNSVKDDNSDNRLNVNNTSCIKVDNYTAELPQTEEKQSKTITAPWMSKWLTQ